MLDSFSYIPRPYEERPEAPRANDRFRRLVHVYMGRKPLPMLERSEEEALVLEARQASGQAAVARLVDHHLPLLNRISFNSARYNGILDHLDELLSEAITAFIEAIPRYKLAEDSARLGTFAAHAVSGAVLTLALRIKYPFVVAKGSSERVFLFGYRRFLNEFREQTGTRFDVNRPDHLAKMVELSGTSYKVIKRVSEIKRTGYTLSSEDFDLVSPDQTKNAEALVISKDIKSKMMSEVGKVTKRLKPRDLEIFMRLLHADNDLAAVRAELAEKYEITKERVGQIYRAHLDVMRDNLKRDGITSPFA